MTLPITHDSEGRARELLDSYLSEQQRWMLANCHYFYVRSKWGAYFALLAHSAIPPVLAVDKRGIPIAKYEIWLQRIDLLPKANQLLGQMLLLTSNPKKFYRTACCATWYPWVRNAFPGLHTGQHFEEFVRSLEPLPPPKRWPQADGLFEC